MLKLFICLFCIVLFSCSDKMESQIEDISEYGVNINLIIGLENQSQEHQLGIPVAVRTDDENNIYIADQASLSIKVFDEKGNYIRTLGGRGKENGKFHEFTSELMGIDEKGNFVFLDRGKMHFKVITKGGEFVESYPYNIKDQVYPTQVFYDNWEVIALYMKTKSLNNNITNDEFERPLFHVHDDEYQKRNYTFLPFHKLGQKDFIAWTAYVPYPGSFWVSNDKDEIYYSPAIYDCSIHIIKKDDNHKWRYEKKVNGGKPDFETYKSISPEEYQDNKPGYVEIHYGNDGPHRGIFYSFGAGVYQLNDGKIVHFYGKRSDTNFPPENNKVDIYGQVFDNNFNVVSHSFVEQTTIEHFANFSLVNWKDKDDNFYLIDTEDGIPVVRRFQLQLPES